MDNRVISIQSEGWRAFQLAFELLWDNCPGGKATHYYHHPKHGLVLLWKHDDFYIPETPNQPALPLPFAMNLKAATDMAWSWLQEQSDSSYQDYCDHDGSMGKGFKVYNEAWGHVANSHYAFLAVVPIWAWYGK